MSSEPSETEQRRTEQHPRDRHDLVIVANRLPVEQRPDGTFGRSPGGLASALASVADEDTKWLGWPGESNGDGPRQLDDPNLYPIELTPREVQIISFSLGNEPRIRMRKRLGISENTLKSQIKGLLRKCNERNVDSLAKNILRAALLVDKPLDAAVIAPWLPLAC